MKKWGVTLSCKVICTYGVEAESAEEAEEIANELFNLRLDHEDADSDPRILSRCEDYEDNVEGVKEWTAS